MPDVAAPRSGHWRLFNRRKCRRAAALVVLVLFSGASVAATASAAPPRKPPKKVAAKKPPSQRGKKAVAKKGTKKPAQRPRATARPKAGVSGKSGKGSGTAKSSAPSKRVGSKNGSAKKPTAQQARKPTAQRRTLSGVSGRKITAKDVKTTSKRLKETGKNRIKTNRAPLTAKRKAEVKERLARARGPRFTGRVLAQGKSAFSSLPASRRDGVRAAFKGGTAKAIRLDRDVVVYRRVGGKHQDRASPWYTDKAYVRPGNARRALSLPRSNTAQSAKAYRIPKGTVVLVGKAAPMVGKPGFGSHATGGGTQIYVSDFRSVKPISTN